MTKTRRKFLRGGALALTGVTAGSIGLSDCSLVRGADGAVAASASFGWEVRHLSGNGANVYFRVANKMMLHTANIDVAFTVLSLPAVPGFAEVLCQGSVSRGAAPTFDNSQGHAYLVQPASTDFDSASVYNPNGLAINEDPTFAQDLFYSVILKAWVPADGVASAASRQVLAQPSLVLNAGDFLVFHMDHAGVPVDGEMQVVLGYNPI